MSAETLSDFLTELEDHRDLVRVSAEVDRHLELTEIVRRLSSAPDGGPAILFEKVGHHSVPVVANLLGNTRRVCRALRVESLDEVADRITALIRPELPEGLLEGLNLLPRLAELVRLPPKTVKAGICQQVVKMGRDVNLADLPLPTFWPDDATPSITGGQVVTRDAETRVRDLDLLPVSVLGRDQLAVHWTPHDDAWQTWRQYRQAGQQMPVAIVFGGDPSLMFAAGMPLPRHVDEAILAGFLRNKNIEFVKCRSLDLEVPANAEWVIEGLIDVEQPLVSMRPLGRETGFYSPADELPVVQVTAMTHRANPVLPVVVPTSPPNERGRLVNASETLFLPLVRLLVPEVVDFHRPASGAYRNFLFVSMRKSYPHQAKKLMTALWGYQPLMTSKTIVVVDETVDVRDDAAVWHAVGAHVDPGCDIMNVEGPLPFDDHATANRGHGQKMGIDATRKWPGERQSQPWPLPLEMSESVDKKVSDRWASYGFADLKIPAPHSRAAQARSFEKS